MNLQEANRMRDRITDLRIAVDKFALRFGELHSLVSSLAERVAALETQRTLRLPKK